MTILFKGKQETANLSRLWYCTFMVMFLHSITQQLWLGYFSAMANTANKRSPCWECLHFLFWFVISFLVSMHSAVIFLYLRMQQRMIQISFALSIDFLAPVKEVKLYCDYYWLLLDLISMGSVGLEVPLDSLIYWVSYFLIPPKPNFWRKVGSEPKSYQLVYIVRRQPVSNLIVCNSRKQT